MELPVLITMRIYFYLKTIQNKTKPIISEFYSFTRSFNSLFHPFFPSIEFILINPSRSMDHHSQNGDTLWWDTPFHIDTFHLGLLLHIYPHSWIVCGGMGNFEYSALFGTGDISFDIKLTTKVMLCSDFIP